MTGKLCGIFTCPCPRLPQFGGALEGGSPPTQGRPLAPVSRGSRVHFIGKSLCLSVLTCLGGYLKHCCRVSVLLKLEVTHDGKMASVAWKHCEAMNNPQSGEANDDGWDTTDCLKPGKKSWGEFYCEKSGHGKAPRYTGEFRKPHMCPRWARCLENIIEDPKLSPLADIQAQCKQEVASKTSCEQPR